MEKQEIENMQKKIETEIKEKKKLPEDVKNNINKKTLINMLVAILISTYLIFLNLGYYNIEKEVLIRDTNVFSLVCLVIAIVLFERAFKKEKGFLGVFGIEILVLAICTLLAPFAYFYLEGLKSGELIRKIYMMLPLFFAIYYVLKCIII